MTKRQREQMMETLSHFVLEGQKKYTKGVKEHGGNLEEKPGMLTNLYSEMIDFVFYESAVRSQIKDAIWWIEQDKASMAKHVLEALLQPPQD